MAVIAVTRAFRLGPTDLPDPDPEMTPQQVLDHYAAQYPTLRFGKVEEYGMEGDRLIFKLVPNEYKPNG